MLAPAKINLFLHVIGKRADGYHALQSLVVFTREGDRVSVQAAQGLSLEVGGVFAGALAGENLALRAAQAFRVAAGVAGGAAVALEKRLPVGAGLGGGSADAAATLKLLAALWRVPVPESLPLELGSDVPACMAAQPVWMEGRGEALTPLRLPFPLHLLLVNPGIGVSTAAMYAKLSAPYSDAIMLPDGLNDVMALVAFLRETRNDFEPHAPVGNVLSALRAQPGCLLARMSGSGATCFGLFADAEGAGAAARVLAAAENGWWVKATETIDADEAQ